MVSTSDGPFFDALLIVLALENVAHEDARRHDVIGVDLPRLDQMLDLGDRDVRGGGHHRIEVPRGLPIQKITNAVASPGLDEREVSVQRGFEHVWLTGNRAGFLAFGNQRPISGRCKETANARAVRP